MPELTITGAVDVVRRQVRRVRLRKNLYELQRTLYWSVTVAATAALVLLPLALLAPESTFAGAAWIAVAVLAASAWRIARGARRGWLARRAAVPWIEQRGALDGRLRTLLEIEGQPDRANAFFRPLLVAEVVRDLDRWTPRRLVPRRLPRAALATAALATAALVLVIRLAALAVPTAPAIVGGRTPLAGEPAQAAAGAPPTAERVVVAPDVAETRPASAAARDASSLASLPSALQESVRRQIWGKAWERVREQLAEATTGGSGTPADRQVRDETTAADDDEEWELARAPTGEVARRRARGGAGDGDGTDRDEPAPPRREPQRAAGAEQSNDELARGGAGNGTAPDLFGPATDDGLGDSDGSFELAIAARMRADRLGDRRADATAPPADRDARPTLAADQRRENAAHRMTVPPAYETVVREVFAHRRSDQP